MTCHDLSPLAPAFMRRVLILHSALSMDTHASRARSPQLYTGLPEEISLDEIERIHV